MPRLSFLVDLFLQCIINVFRVIGADLWTNEFCPQQNGYFFLKRPACLLVFIKSQRAKRQDNRNHQINSHIVSDRGARIPEGGKPNNASRAEEGKLSAGQVFNELRFDLAKILVYGDKAHGSHPLMRVKNRFGKRSGFKERETEKQGISHCRPHACRNTSRRGKGHCLD